MFGPLVEEHEKLFDAVLRPLLPPRHPLELARFGISAVRSAAGLARSHFRGERARALFAGLAAHSLLPLTAAGSASFGLVLGTAAHIWGWPMPRGGSQRIADALATHLKGLGGSIVTNNRVLDAGELAGADAVMFDTSPRVVVSIAGNDLQPRYRTRLLRFRAGPGAFKMDWALSAPIPWRAMECARAGTVHLGGTLDEISRGEREVAEGRHPERPFVLLAQPSLFDDSRAPLGRHTAWAYCHVPNGSTVDMCARIEAQVERFAPGFRDLILARHHTAPADFERDNANYTGGDIAGGANDLWQTFARPVLAVDPYLVHAGRDRAWFICSASTPPGAGVHGMCGFNAAESALRRLGMKG
jgi:phytoene dehydrogenase-like protein